MCFNCVYARPLDVHKGVVYCERLGTLQFSDKSGECPHFTKVTLDELLRRLGEVGYVYCASCGERLYSDAEVAEHLSRGHSVLPNEPFSDEVAAEEAPAAD